MMLTLNIWDNSIKEKIENLKKNPNIKKIIINGLYEFEYDKITGSMDVTLDLIKFAELHNIEIHIITSCHSDQKLLPHYNHVHIHNWYTFWLTLTFTRLVYHKNYEFNKNLGLDFYDINVNKNSEIQTPYITMNKLPKVHRAIMIDMLAKNNVLRKDCVIWREWCTHYQFKYWEQEILLMDQPDKFECQEIFPQQYVNSFMQLVTESNEYTWFFSEKTAMPLFFNKPFLVAGCIDFHKKLQNLGFVLYDELFDYSFDQEPDTVKRYDMLSENIKRYVNKSNNDLQKLYSSVFDKCQFNKKMAMKLATDSTLRPNNIWQELIDYQVQNNIPDFPNDINNFILENENVYRF